MGFFSLHCVWKWLFIAFCLKVWTPQFSSPQLFKKSKIKARYWKHVIFEGAKPAEIASKEFVGSRRGAVLSTEPTGSSAQCALSLGCAGGHRQTRLGCQQQAVWMFRGQASRLRHQLWWAYGVQGFASSFLPVGKAWGKKNVEDKALGKGTWVGLNLKKNVIIGVLWVGIFFMHILKVSSEKHPRIQNLKQNKSSLICCFGFCLFFFF